jgi:hypothetical protein
LDEGDEEQFQRLVQQSADYARKAGDQWALLMALNNLGVLAFNAGISTEQVDSSMKH